MYGRLHTGVPCTGRRGQVRWPWDVLGPGSCSCAAAGTRQGPGAGPGVPDEELEVEHEGLYYPDQISGIFTRHTDTHASNQTHSYGQTHIKYADERGPAGSLERSRSAQGRAPTNTRAPVNGSEHQIRRGGVSVAARCACESVRARQAFGMATSQDALGAQLGVGPWAHGWDLGAQRTQASSAGAACCLGLYWAKEKAVFCW